MALNAGGAPTMSVAIRSQSGSKPAFLIHSCRSPVNSVPGATIGLGADSHKKCWFGIAQQDLRDEKVLVGGQVERGRKNDVKQDFLAGDWPVPTGLLIRERVDSRIHAIGGREARIKLPHTERQVARR